MDAVAPVVRGFRSSAETVGPIRIGDSSGVGEARRAAQRASSRALLTEADAGRVALVVTELSTNLVKHAGGGTMFFQPHTDGTNSVLITAIDRGPGMDVQITMRDGHSSAGTSGNGLGAIRRMSDALDIQFPRRPRHDRHRPHRPGRHPRRRDGCGPAAQQRGSLR